MKFGLLFFTLVLFSVSAHAQQAATTDDGRRVILNKDGTWKFTNESAASTITLKIEAGIVYNYGGPQPLARTPFLLMDTNPTPELEKISPTEGHRRFAKNAADELFFTCGSNMPEAMSTLRNLTKYRFTTGFDGKAKLSDI